MRLSTLSGLAIQRLLNDKLALGLSPGTVLHIRDVLRVALNIAVRWKLLVSNPVLAVVPPQRPRSLIQVFTPQQAQTFLRAADTHRRGALFILALSTGMSQGEILGLCWEDVNLESGEVAVEQSIQRIDGTLSVQEVKAPKRRRIVSLPEVTRRALRALPGPRSGLVFHTSSGLPIDKRNVVRWFHGILKAAGLPQMRFHDLRHSVASLLLAKGVAPRAIMELLGHSDVRTTMTIYSHVLPELRRQVARKTQAILSPVASKKSSDSAPTT